MNVRIFGAFSEVAAYSRKAVSVFTITMLVLLGAPVSFSGLSVASAATVSLIDSTSPSGLGSFGTGSTVNDIPSWDEEGSDNSATTDAEAAGSGNDSASPNGGRFAKIAQDEWICTVVSASGYNNLLLSYYWRGDSDAESSDHGIVEYKAGSGDCSDFGWTQLKSHDLSVDSSWSTQSAFSLPGALNNTSFRLRFRADSTQGDEYFRVDGILLTGDSSPTTGDLTITKTTVGGDGTFDFAISGTTTVAQVTTSGGTGSVTVHGLTPTTYTVTETVPTGWVKGADTCITGVTVTSGNTATCGVTNTKLGSITISKQTLPGDLEQTFNFSMQDGDALTPFSLSDGQSHVFDNLAAGQYTVTEDSTEGFDLTGLTCDDDNGLANLSEGTATLNVGAGENISCVYTNTERGSFTLHKVTDPAVGLYDFTLGYTGETAQDNAPTTSPEMVQGDWSVDNLLPSESYSLAETIVNLPEENQYPSWSRNASCSGNYGHSASGSLADDATLGLTIGAGEAMTCYVNNTENAVIAGKKFEDTDGTGEGATGPVLSGWSISIVGTGDTEYATTTQVTDENGDYSFVVAPGTYRVCEVPQDGWYQSVPSEGADCDGSNGYDLTVAAGDISDDNDFGNYQNGAISGFKFHDDNANGSWDESESALSGWTIYIDTNNNGVLDDGEPSTVTDENGLYTFSGLTPATYIVREVVGEGYAQTAPAASYHSVTVTSGAVENGKNFGNVEDATISGNKWNDVNDNGVWDDGESAPDHDFTFHLYKWDGEAAGDEVAEPQTGTSYDFTGLLPGTYVVLESSTSGWMQTYPSDNGGHIVTVGVNEDSANNNFGNVQVTEVSGMKFNDLNHNGHKNYNEHGIEGWTITATPMVYADVFDGESTTTQLVVDESRTVKTTTTAADGSYLFKFLGNETGQWRISEENRAGWSQTLPGDAGYYDLNVETDGTYNCEDFGNWQEPIVTIFKWSDENSNGEQDDGEQPVADYPVAVGNMTGITEGDGGADTIDTEIVALALTGSDGLAQISLDPAWFGGFNELDQALALGHLFAFEGTQDNWNKTYPTFGNNDTMNLIFRDGVATTTLAMDSFFDVFSDVDQGTPMTQGRVHDMNGESPLVSLYFGNHFTAPVTETSGGGSGGNGGGGNGPIVGSYGAVNGGGQVLGASTEFTPAPGASCSEFITDFMGPNSTNNPDQVKHLQTVLASQGFDVSFTGVYDAATVAAVKAFQLKYADEILTPWGLTQPTGIVYITTRKKLNELYCTSEGQTFPLTPAEQKIIDNYKSGGNANGGTQVTPPPTDETTPPADTTGTSDQPQTEPDTTSQAGAAAASDNGGGFWSKLRHFLGL